MTRTSPTALALILALLGAGCGGVKESRNTARILVGQTLRYQDEVAAKRKTEQAYYKASIGTLMGDAKRGAFNAELLEGRAASQDLARQILDLGRPVLAADVRDFLLQRAKPIFFARDEELKRAELEMQQLESGLQQLDLHNEMLTRTRQLLESLQVPRNTEVRFEELIRFGEQVKRGLIPSPAASGSQAVSPESHPPRESYGLEPQ